MKKSLFEIISLVTVSLIANGSSYIAYLILTYFGMPPKIAMTLLYVLCALIIFMGNKRYTFQYQQNAMIAFIRYGFTQLLGYLIYLSCFLILVDNLGYPHQLVQAFGFVLVSGFLYMMYKFFVFHEKVERSAT